MSKVCSWRRVKILMSRHLCENSLQGLTFCRFAVSASRMTGRFSSALKPLPTCGAPIARWVRRRSVRLTCAGNRKRDAPSVNLVLGWVFPHSKVNHLCSHDMWPEIEEELPLTFSLQFNFKMLTCRIEMVSHTPHVNSFFSLTALRHD